MLSHPLPDVSFFPMTFSRKILQFYHKVIRNESRESCADKTLDHSSIVAYFKEGKTIALHRDLDITDEMAELDGVSSSSADVETSTHVEMQPSLFAELTLFFCRNMAWKQMVPKLSCCVGC
jgi:hypothetical protein